MNFNDLFVFDIANNHQGDVDHATKIINECGTITEEFDIRSAFKFQFRDLGTLVHKNYMQLKGNKHIERFFSTRLTIDQYSILLDKIKKTRMMSMCTPFDEKSVEDVVRLGFDIVKIASCSATDWPLIEAISETNLPIIFSTGGLTVEQIDDLVSFFDHKGSDYAIMHCVSIYPTEAKDCNLAVIDFLKRRYPDKVIGWSTHEPPESKLQIAMAYAKGARIFERHIGLKTDKYPLNSYSSTPDELRRWIKTYKETVLIEGSHHKITNTKEIHSLSDLKRGVYAKDEIVEGEKIQNGNVYFAMPLNDGQLEAGEWEEGMIATNTIKPDSIISHLDIIAPPVGDSKILKKAIHQIKAMLHEASVVISDEFDIEYSHHYGIKNFKDIGTTIINVINREYCKKILVQLPGQRHPTHYHKLKEETFQVLYGELIITIDGKEKRLQAGETALVLPGVWHSFESVNGCVFEEVSTTHYNNDSVYKDTKINKLERRERKTCVSHWGRWQIDQNRM